MRSSKRQIKKGWGEREDSGRQRVDSMTKKERAEEARHRLEEERVERERAERERSEDGSESEESDESEEGDKSEESEGNGFGLALAASAIRRAWKTAQNKRNHKRARRDMHRRWTPAQKNKELQRRKEYNDHCEAEMRLKIKKIESTQR